jgi:small GTP-binding protein
MDKDIKLMIVGDDKVGKTHFARAWVDKNNDYFYVSAPTIFDNYSYNYKFEDKEYIIYTYDTSGREDYDRLRPIAYPDTKLVFICFKVTDIKSFENVKSKWVEEIKFHLPDTPFALIGLQIDLRGDEDVLKKLDGKKPISYSEGLELSKEIGALCYSECSAKNYFEVEETFKEGIETYIKKYMNKNHDKEHHKCLLM